ncbi:hypothetical protein BH11PSE12_BH11PSE12_17210 [soil metagenome]
MSEGVLLGYPTVLKGLSDDAVELLKEHCQFVSIKKYEDSPWIQFNPIYMTFIEKGWITAHIDNCVVGIIGPGQVIYNMQATTVFNSSTNGHLKAISDVSAFIVKKEPLFELLQNRGDLVRVLYELGLQRLGQAHVSAYNQIQKTLEFTLLEFLWRMGTPMPDGCRLVPLLKQAELAECLNIQPTAISPIKRKLKLGGYFRKNEEGQWYMTKKAEGFLR